MSNPNIPARTSSTAHDTSNVGVLNTSSSRTAHSRPKDPTENGKQEQWIARGSSQPLSLDGIVDLTNTVDTDVTTKILPAVTHEHVTPTVREIRQEVITREIHKHDVFHRILPIIETEILPTKHYVASADGKTLTEIPAHMVPGRTVDGSPSRNWEIRETAMGRGDDGSIFQPPRTLKHKPSSSTLSAGSYSSARSGFASDSADLLPSDKGKETAPLTSDVTQKRNPLEPILSSKKEYTSKEGHPKTEYVWRHPPVFETANGKTQPIDYDAERSVQTTRHSTGAINKYSYIPRSTQGDVPPGRNRVSWSTNDRQVSNEQGGSRDHRRRSLEGNNKNAVSDVPVELGGSVADVERGMADLKVGH